MCTSEPENGVLRSCATFLKRVRAAPALSAERQKLVAEARASLKIENVPTQVSFFDSLLQHPAGKGIAFQCAQVLMIPNIYILSKVLPDVFSNNVHVAFNAISVLGDWDDLYADELYRDILLEIKSYFEIDSPIRLMVDFVLRELPPHEIKKLEQLICGDGSRNEK